MRFKNAILKVVVIITKLQMQFVQNLKSILYVKIFVSFQYDRLFGFVSYLILLNSAFNSKFIIVYVIKSKPHFQSTI